MDFYAELGVPVPRELIHDFVAKLSYVSEAIEDAAMAPEERSRVRFKLRKGREAESALVASRIAEVAQKMCASYRPSETKVLAIGRCRDVPFNEDPHPLLAARGELFEYGEGRWGLGPRTLRLIEFFEQGFLRMADEFSATRLQFPSLIGADTMDRCKYLQSFPHSLTLVTHLREDLQAIQQFAQSVKWDADHLTCDEESLSSIQCLLAPSVCFHYYEWLRDQQLAEPRAISAAGKCFRYESRNLLGLERLWDFTMREIVFAGSQEYVLAQRQRAIDATVSLFDEWGLAYEIASATDPFFIEEYSMKTKFQSVFDLKFEARAALPFKQSDLAVGSFNYHQDFFGRSFNISDADGKAAHTSCVGFGLERLVLAFVAQYGLESARWPASVASSLA